MLGLQLQDLLTNVTNDTGSTVCFMLAETDLMNSGNNIPAHISDLCPPVTIPVLHVSLIDIELIFHNAEDSQLGGIDKNACTARIIGKTDACTEQRNAVMNRCTALALSALQRFFTSQPAVGSKLCVPRMFRSSCLAELAPGVFSPAYPQAIRPRQKLIPTIARTLAAFSGSRRAGESTTTYRPSAAESSSCSKGFEERLWVSMVGALKVPPRGQGTGSPAKTTLGVHDAGESKTSTDVPTELELEPEPHVFSTKARVVEEWPSLFSMNTPEEEVPEERDPIGYSDEDTLLLDASDLEAESLLHPQESAATETACVAHPGNTSTVSADLGGQNYANAWDKEEDGECFTDLFTQVNNNRKCVSQLENPCRSQEVDERDLLIHNMHSAHPLGDVEVEDMDLKNLVSCEDEKPILMSAPAAGSYRLAHDDMLLLSPEARIYSVLAEHESDLFRADRTPTPDIAAHQSCHSLSDGFGGNGFPWNTRDGQDSHILEMPDTYGNDPDAMLLTETAHDGPFDLFNISCKSTHPMLASSLATFSHEMFDEVEDSTWSPQTSQSSATTNSFLLMSPEFEEDKERLYDGSGR